MPKPPLLMAGFGGGEDALVIGLSGLQEVIDNPGQLVGRGCDRFRCSEPGPHPPVKRAQLGMTMMQRLRGESERLGHTMAHIPCPGGEHLSATDAVIGAETQPTRKVLAGGEGMHLSAEFREE